MQKNTCTELINEKKSMKEIKFAVKPKKLTEEQKAFMEKLFKASVKNLNQNVKKEGVE